MTDRIIIEQVILGEDSLDLLNKKVNEYITDGFQPKDPMLEIHNIDGNQYHYTQTMARYIADPNPDNLGQLIVKYIKATGIDALLDSYSPEEWDDMWKSLAKALNDQLDETFQ